MAKYILIILLLSLVAWFVINRQSVPSIQKPNIPIATPVAAAIELEFENELYNIFLQKVDNNKTLRLIPNFSEKLSSTEVAETNNCSFLSSGQFYTVENKPLGYLEINGRMISPLHNRSFFNGFVVSQNGRPEITDELPDTAMEFAFQSGPLIYPGRPLKLSSDEAARRILLGETETGEIFFLGISQSENEFSGPLLADLPEIIQQFNNIKMQQFKNLINLDGGTASVFINDSTNLAELAPVGSFLCIQK